FCPWGPCRWAQNCRFSHDRKSSHICRYFQSGFCSYGERCSRAFCGGCIRKWRRSRDFQSTVIKACPECRVTSSYYIPHKYWVSDGGEKEKLIETFKARTGKIRCKFFVQNRGRCPFKSDCIYLHELPEFSPSPLESSDEEDEFCMLEWAFTLALMETDFRFFTDFSDSD
ncbi:PREDICTED: probable E3 ubiquitin-protein ligase makorin-2, partial [Phaethon lepturus]|uniref:probable E3 ubiquitin-protein ligase makorin-2 n=1 Tax=Phaethon lepturus TaxID=97097 RepID=UPI000530BD07